MTITAKMVKELRDRTAAGMLDCKKALEATEGNIDAAIDWLREKGIASAQKKSGRIAAEGTTNILVDGNQAVIIEINSETDFVAKNTQFVELVDSLSKVILENNPADLDAALALEVNGETVESLVTAATATIGEKITLRRFEVVSKEDAQAFGSYIHMGGKISALTVVNGSEELARDIAMQVASMAPQYVSQKEIPADVIEHETNIQIEIVNNDEDLKEKPEQVIAGIIKGRVSKTMQDISLVDQVYFKDGKAKVQAFLKDNNAEVLSFVRYGLGEGIEKKVEDFAEEVAKAAQV